jgi:hypothetical protein
MKSYLLVLVILLFFSCDKHKDSAVNLDRKKEWNEDNNISGCKRGKIIGYLKCFTTVNGKSLIGFFVISNDKDSLLSFNIAPSFLSVDTSLLSYGIRFYNGDSISFNFKKAEGSELKYYNCPPTTMQLPTFYSINRFSQVIISNIKKIR